MKIFFSLFIVSCGALFYSSIALAEQAETTAPAHSLEASSEEDGKTIAVGTIDTLEFDFIPRIVIGNTSIVDVQKDEANPRAVRIVPKKKGTTSAIISDERGKIVKRISYNIIANELSQKVLAIRRLLSDIEGITIESVEEKIVIDGELVVPRDFDRILQVSSAYPEVLNLVTLSKISREAIAKRMQKEINDDPAGVNVQVKLMNDVFFLLGKVDSNPDKERAETIAQTLMPEMGTSEAIKAGVIVPGTQKKYSIRNLIMVDEAPPSPPPKMVRITYHFVEIGKEFLKTSFFKWVPLLSEGSGIQIGQSTTGGVASTSNGSFSGLITNLLPKIQSGANGGFVRVLFSTVLMGEQDVETELVRQDQIPFISGIVNGVPVTAYQPVGINVKVKPSIIGEEKMRMETSLKFEAAKGAGAGTNSTITVTQLKNNIILKSGDSAAIGGLVSSDTAKDIDKDPEAAPSGNTPQGTGLFTLLRSKAFRNKKTEFVVFITPKIITDAAEGTADIKAKILNNNKKRKRIVQ